MSLEFIEGFDGYTNDADMALKWTYVQGAAFTTGTFGGQCVSLNSPGSSSPSALEFPYHILDSSLATRVIGFAFKASTAFGLWNGPVLYVCDGIASDYSLAQLILKYNCSTGALQVYRGDGTLLGITSGLYIPVNTWVYIEFKYTINSSSGSIEIRSSPGSGSQLLVTGINTQHTANASANVVCLGNYVSAFFIDDLYVCNTSGSVNNDFLGECRIRTLLPAADSSINNGWTPNTGTSHHAGVITTEPSSEPAYNSTATAGAIDTYEMTPPSGIGTILAVAVTASLRKDDAGTRVAAVEWRSNVGNEHTGPDVAVYDQYTIVTRIMEANPEGGATWVNSDLVGAEPGVKLIS